MDGVARAVAQNLHLDMARTAEILFEIDGGVAEGGLRFVARGHERGLELVLGQRKLHAAPAAARRRLDQKRIADLARGALRFLHVLDRARSRHDRNADLLRGDLGLDLVAHQPNVLGGRADEGDVVLIEDLGEAGILGEEAVAGMNRVGAGDLAGGDDGWNVEVAVLGRRGADAHALVGEAHMHGVGVGGRMHRDSRDAQFLAGALDAKRDLSPVCDQDLVEHRAPVSVARSPPAARHIRPVARPRRGWR